MAAIRLLAAPIDPSHTSEVDVQSTSLVPINRLAIATRKAPSGDTAYPGDNYTWTASAGSDGSFTFYAVPQKQSGNGQASSQWDGDASSAGWNTQALRNAAAQYALNASLPPPMYGSGYTTGTLVNVYA
jgi:hypothetical protein